MGREKDERLKTPLYNVKRDFGAFNFNFNEDLDQKKQDWFRYSVGLFRKLYKDGNVAGFAILQRRII